MMQWAGAQKYVASGGTTTNYFYNDQQVIEEYVNGGTAATYTYADGIDERIAMNRGGSSLLLPRQPARQHLPSEQQRRRHRRALRLFALRHCRCFQLGLHLLARHRLLRRQSVSLHRPRA